MGIRRKLIALQMQHRCNAKGDKMVIVVANFKGGVGKSTIANFLAEKFGGYVLSLDFYQKNKKFNFAKTIDVKPDEDIKDKIKTNDICIIDAGGFDDSRLYNIDVDAFIFPTRTDELSIETTVDTAVTALAKSKSKKKKAIFVINEYYTEQEKEEAAEKLQEILEKSIIDADEVYLNFIKRSNAVRTAIKYAAGLEELYNTNKAAYKKINEMFDELVQDIKDAIRNEQ